MAYIGAPTNPTDQRDPVHGEVAEIEQQEAAAPTGPDQRGREPNPMNALDVATAPPPAEPQVMSGVTPPMGEPYPTGRVRPTTIEEQVGMAMLGMGSLTTMGKRMAYALYGKLQEPGVQTETPPRDLWADSLLPNVSGIAPPEGAEPMTEEEEAAEQAMAAQVSAPPEGEA